MYVRAEDLCLCTEDIINKSKSKRKMCKSWTNSIGLFHNIGCSKWDLSYLLRLFFVLKPNKMGKQKIDMHRVSNLDSVEQLSMSILPWSNKIDMVSSHRTVSFRRLPLQAHGGRLSVRSCDRIASLTLQLQDRFQNLGRVHGLRCCSKTFSKVKAQFGPV